MKTESPDGRSVEVRRRWSPWRLRMRRSDNFPFGDLNGLDIGDGIEGIVIGLVMLVFGGLILTLAILASEALLLIVLLIPLLIAARALWVLPWTIEARSDGTRLGVARVRGWRASSERIQELADAYRLGQDPFPVSSTSPST